MKLKDLNDAIATACNVRANVVASVQTETFKQIKAALEKGEKVLIPEFGLFLQKDVAGAEGQPGKKVLKFRARGGEGEGKGKKGGEGKKGGGKKNAGQPAKDDDASDED
jgi:nucleoid DNA-binding protein